MNKKLLCVIFLIFFTAQNITFAQISSVSDSSLTQPVHSNLHYFLIDVKAGSLNGKTNDVANAFATPRFNSVDVNENQSKLRITAFKGTKIGDIKMILAGLNIGIKNFREEYTNSAPSFFLNH